MSLSHLLQQVHLGQLHKDLLVSVTRFIFILILFFIILKLQQLEHYEPTVLLFFSFHRISIASPKRGAGTDGDIQVCECLSAGGSGLKDAAGSSARSRDTETTALSLRVELWVLRKMRSTETTSGRKGHKSGLGLFC